MSVAVCADVGSTFTKVAAIDVATGAVLATAEHPTTVETDVLHGLDAAVAQLGRKPSTMDVCSSAGGGLRLAVVGYEELVTAEAGHRVGLSAGARVVHVAAGRLDRSGLAALNEARPDVVLLVGGTDGGDSEVLRHNARSLSARRGGVKVPVVVAGNSEVRDEALAMLGPSSVGTANVLPRIGELNPMPARAAIREVFLRHVIGGKHLSRGPRFASLVRGATPDVVLAAVEGLADVLGGDVLVLDVGGATTDVYSILSPDPDAPEAMRSADVAGTLWHSRTVEGDLGVRWSAPSVVTAAARERLLRPGEEESLGKAAQARANDPAFLPDDADDWADEARLAELAATVAVRRHARGRDLRRVRLLIGSGGVLRHQPAAAETILDGVLNDHAGGWALPRTAEIVVDADYVLAPAGLLAPAHPRTSEMLLTSLLHKPPRDMQAVGDIDDLGGRRPTRRSDTPPTRYFHASGR
jgi:uncharacterized protein (TIGR01319 family)